MSLLPFHWHVVELVAVGATLTLHVRIIRDPRRRRLGAFALLSLLAVIIWPVGDLAASVSLTVATIQRLVIMLLVAPLLLLSLPLPLLARLTSPRVVDAVVQRLVHPALAIAVVTLVGTLTLAAPVVDWAANSMLARDLVLVLVLVLGFVLWMPALAIMPGTKHLSPIARAAYIFVAALAVTSLSIVWIFARHPLYPGLHHQHELIHMSALLDQQVAGFVAKLGAYIPMWTVAFTIFSRAEERGDSVEETPLHWADVERELLRSDRRKSRQDRRAQS